MKYDFKKQLRSFGYAWKGIRCCIGKEQNLSFHLIATAVVVIAGFVLGITRMEWMIIILCIGVVIAAELFNSAIEKLVDLVSPERHPIAGQVKDIAAGAVLVCAATAGYYRIDCIYPLPHPLLLIIRIGQQHKEKYGKHSSNRCHMVYLRFVHQVASHSHAHQQPCFHRQMTSGVCRSTLAMVRQLDKHLHERDCNEHQYSQCRQ